MALTIKREPVEQMAGEASQVAVTVRDGQRLSLDFMPAHRVDKWNANPAVIQLSTIDRNVSFKSLFFTQDARGDTVRVKGISEYGSSTFGINKPEEVAAVARNFGLEPNVVESISYTQSSDRLTDVSLTLKEGVPPEAVARAQQNVVLALESNAILPAGSAFELTQQQVLRADTIDAETNAHNELKALQFGVADNKYGQPFTIKAAHEGRTELVFGANHQMEHGSLYRQLSQPEFVAAQKLAAVLDATLTGEAGITPTGASIILNRPLGNVVADLESSGVIAKGTSEALRAFLSEESVGLPRPPGQRRGPSEAARLQS